MLYFSPPADFNPPFEISKCYLECQGKILLLLRAKGKTEGEKWGVPGGKISAGESRLQAMSRELLEETGIRAGRESFDFLRTVYVRYPEFDFVCHMFNLSLSCEPAVKLSSAEHSDFMWTEPARALAMDLVKDEKESIMHTFL